MVHCPYSIGGQAGDSVQAACIGIHQGFAVRDCSIAYIHPSLFFHGADNSIKRLAFIQGSGPFAAAEFILITSVRLFCQGHLHFSHFRITGKFVGIGQGFSVRAEGEGSSGHIIPSINVKVLILGI